MKLSNRAVITFLVVIVIAAASVFVGFRLGGQHKTVASSSTETNSSFKTFVSDQMKLSFSYPAIPDIGTVKDGNPIQIPSDTQEMPNCLISSQDTGYATIKDWFAAQPKGDSSHAGLKPIMWIDTDRVIAEEYEVVDHNGSKPIYGKHLDAFILEGTKLAKIKFGGETHPEEAITTDSDTMSMVTTLKFEL